MELTSVSSGRSLSMSLALGSPSSPMDASDSASVSLSDAFPPSGGSWTISGPVSRVLRT